MLSVRLLAIVLSVLLLLAIVLSVLLLLAIVVTILLRFTASYYHFGIFKIFLPCCFDILDVILRLLKA
jgi:hypothetical protein